MRIKNRIPIVMRFFRKNPLAFSKFLEIDTEEQLFRKIKNNFEQHFEEIMMFWIENYDLRFGQMLIIKGITPDSHLFHREEDDWLVSNGYIKPEQIFFWGTLGKSYQEDAIKYYSEKPVWNAPLDDVEKFFYKGLKNYEIYHRRMSEWENKKPKHKYVLLKDLEKEHIENILKDGIKGKYKPIFERLLDEKRKD